MRVTFWRQFRFEAAHYLSGFEGKCGHIHGHNYVLSVRINGVPGDDGFIIASDELKAAVKPLTDRLDHALIIDNLPELSNDGQIDVSEFWGNVVEIGKRPTTENLAIWIYDQILLLGHKDILGREVSIDLQETHAMGVSIP